MAQSAIRVGRRAVERAEPAHQAYQILHLGYTILPMLFGLDKFFHVMTNWTNYLSPMVTGYLPVAPNLLMQGIGVVEIIAGLTVAIKPSIGGYIVAAWMWAITINLMLLPAYDIALRDFGLSLGALALARLARQYQHG